VVDNPIKYALANPSPTREPSSLNESKETGVGAWEPSEYRDDAPTIALANSYFARNRERQPDIVEDLIGESKITVLGGDYGVGKSPLIADLVLHITNGLEWCGRKVEKRPVIHFDFETPATKYKTDLENGSKRLCCPLPEVPEMLQPFFQHDGIKEPTTERLMEALGSIERCLALVEESLKKNPKSVVIFDPVELFVPINKLKGTEIVAFYQQLRKLFGMCPHAGVLCTFNLRKPDAKNPNKSNLLRDPRGWLQEVSGVNEIMTRSDIRIGIDFFDDEQTVRVINGIQRGELFDPLLIQPAGDPEAGFELCPTDRFRLIDVFTMKQSQYWEMLPQSFTFNEGLRAGVPRTSLSRIIKRAKSVGLLRWENEKWVKPVHRHGCPGKLELVN
jgi:hypothetical protein